MSTSISVFLTPKQRAFCDEYLVDRNATAAALRAGYSQSIALNGYLMTIPKIKQYINERCDRAAEQAQVNHDMVLRELCKIAFADMREYFLPDGGLKPIHELGENEAAALWSTTITEKGIGADASTITRVRMYNKLAALDKIAKHLNFYEPKESIPEREYVYLNDAELNKDDRYGDEAYEKAAQEQVPDIAVTENGDVLCDGKGELKFKIELHETFDENLERLEGYEQQLGRPIQNAWVDAPDDADHRDLPLYKEIVKRAIKAGTSGGGYDSGELCWRFMFVRGLESMYKVPTFAHGGVDVQMC